MKKLIITSFLLALFISVQSVQAYSEQRDDGFDDPTISRIGKIYSENEMKDAMKKRYYNYITNKIRTNAVKNRKAQYFRHTISRAKANTNERSTFLDRNGELKFVPYYKDRRSHSSLNTTVPNNPKRNFRTRAYDYYVEGGEAGKKALTEGVINGETHRVQRSFYHRTGNQNYADILSQVRSTQRKLDSPDQVPTGYQAQTSRRGDWKRYMMHPYMFKGQ